MKHKMWSRLLSMALAVMMIASIVPNSAFAEAASEITSTSQMQVEETPVEETQTPQEEVTVPEAETPAEPSTEPAPTEEPVAEPTAEPTVEPTAEPTQAPAETAVPSEQPSAEPTAAPEGTETPEGTAVPSETPAPSASPLPSESPVPSETPVPTETPEATEKPAIDGQALLDELMAIEDNEAFMKAVNELTEEQAAALEALGEEALAEYALRVETLTAQEETVELNAEDKEFTAAVKDAEGVTVTVKVPAGSLPVNAQLVAEMIEQDTEKYTKAEEALADETLNEQPTEYAGMVAMDIRFEVDGEEIEPLQPVEVTIDAQALLPEDADPETVAVQHLKEDETGAVVAVETVADATEETGDVTVEATQTEEPAMDMASTFAVDGFSTFTITWGYYRSVTVYYVDEEGHKIDGSKSGIIEKDVDDWVSLSQYAGTISGYEFAEYKCGGWFENSTHMANADENLQIRYKDGRNSGYYYRIGDDGREKEIDWGNYYYHNIYLVYTQGNKGVVETVDSSKNIEIDLFNYDVTENSNINANRTFKFGGNESQDFNKWSGYVVNDLEAVYQDIVAAKGVKKDDNDQWYPVLNQTVTGSSASLDYLFDDSSVSGKTSYAGLNHLFLESEYADTGYYVYNSADNFAHLDAENKIFTVYDQPTKDDAKFMPFNDINANGTLQEGAKDFYFGMHIGFQMLQPENGQVTHNGNTGDMVFKFNGDDDLWVFIDGVLVLDLGGIHGAAEGSINFADGTVSVPMQSSNTNGVSSGIYRDENNPNNTKWKWWDQNTTIKDLMLAAGANESQFDGNTFADWSSHRVDIYYMERGAGKSNCKMEFNIQTIPQGSMVVSKTVEGADSASVANAEYTFKLLDNSGKAIPNASYTVGDDVKATGSDGTFTLKANQVARFTNLSPAQYMVQELDPDRVMVAGYDYVGTTADGVEGTQTTVTVEPSRVATVDFVNKYEDSDPEPGEDIEREPTYVKQANRNANGNYDLSLSVSGKVDTTQTTQMLDVIFVLDKSGSMKRSMYDDYSAGNSRRDKASAAINSLVNSLAIDKGFDARFALVTFAGDDDDDEDRYNDAWISQGWTKTASDITDKTSPYSNGGTNYEAGLVEAKELLKTARDKATTAVIFVSDGDPTFYYDKDGYTGGSGSGDPNGTCLQHAKDLAATLQTDYFFTVGVGPKDNYQKLKDLAAAALVPEANRKFYEGNSETALNDAFNDIRGSLTSIALSDVRIEDTLSEYVNAVTSNGAPASLQIKVTNGGSVVKQSDRNANQVELTLDKTSLNNAATLTATYDAQSKQVVLDFPKEYQLENNWVYEVIIEIEPNEKAEAVYAENGYSYPDNMTGDPGTGTHEEQNGFDSNVEGNAKVYYTSEGKKYYNEYDMPVVQLDTTEVTITKTFDGLSVDQVPANFKIKVANKELSLPTDNSSTSYSWKLNLPDGSYSFQESGYVPAENTNKLLSDVKVSGLQGSEPTIPEAGAAIDLGTLVLDSKSAQEVTVGITNFYADTNGYLRIDKVIEGTPYNDGRDVFVFKVTAQTGRDAGKVWYFSTNKAGTVVESLELPVGNYKVEEMSNINYEDPSFAGVNNGVVGITSSNTKENPATVTCTNTPKTNPGITDGSGVVNRFTDNGEGVITITPEKIAGDVATTPDTPTILPGKEDEE